MLTDKQLKKQFKIEASKTPEKYYAVNYLKSEGFVRKQCKCGTMFYTVDPDRKVCGDPECAGGFSFIGNTPAKKPMDYVETWKEFAKLFKKQGYTPIQRYPVVARWRGDQYWVGASIYDFQPHVVTGVAEPPANPLVVPQFCLRFNDIDNVGVTGAHYTGFIMIGQHQFVPKEEWNQEKVFADIHNWLKKGLGLPNEEITFHEDAWAGGGNLGPCMEYFSRGLELGNQVYMLYQQTPQGRKELKLKVLDMGMGHERNTWFSQGTSTSYETTFPTVSKKMYKITGIKPESALMKKFLPLSSYLNVDEVEDIDRTWKEVAKKIGMGHEELKSKIQPLAALYSVAEHARSSLFAINDGALPSNVGGGYNLRVILRRAMAFLDKYKWQVSMNDLVEWHADYLKPLFPELSENLNDVQTILDNEKKKYYATKKKSKQMIRQILSRGNVSEGKMLELYDSHGISPDMIQEQAKQMDKTVKVPDDFYSKVAERHTDVAQEGEVKEHLDLKDIDDTEILYYRDFALVDFKGVVLKIIGNRVILDKTVFYPTSGGQAHDTGTINGIKVVDVYKQDSIIVHVLEKKPGFKKRDIVDGVIDYDRRLQLAQHHTATHIINGAARAVLGNHIYQAGANKHIDKARLDITHYDSLSDDEVRKIEELANKVVEGSFPVYSELMQRNLAEAEHGFRIYQGGAVPGRIIRIINIPDFDVEACAGTHLHLTSEAEKIKILKTSKIQDGIVRIEFCAGKAAENYVEKEMSVLVNAAKILDCEIAQVPGRAEELFDKWKKVVKKKKIDSPDDFKLLSKEVFEGDALQKTAEILRTQPQFITNTILRFKKQLEEKMV